MDLSPDQRIQIFDAAALGIRFNAPLGDQRAEELFERLAALVGDTVVDLGCGVGSGSRALASTLAPHQSVHGLDTNPVLVDAAISAAQQDGSLGQVTFEVANANSWMGPDGGAICIGASHALGGPAEMVQHISDGVPNGGVLIGEAFWQSEPDDWCLEFFGEMPRSTTWFESQVQDLGWTVVQAEVSSLSEWDDFETAWCTAARSEGSPMAVDFTAKRSADYARYRGVLGFCWLLLER